MKAHIISTASYLPEKVLTNADLEKIVDTSDEWIVNRTGMKERRIAASDESTSDMGAIVAKKALKDAGLEAGDVDLILVATLSPDHIFPSTACLIQEAIGAENAGAMDLGAACSGMIYLLNCAKAYIESGLAKNVLAIASEKVSAFIDYTDRNTCVLFGDGAAACVVSSEPKGLEIRSSILGSDGKGAKMLGIPAGGSRKPTTAETLDSNQHFLQMDGKAVYKHAIRRMEHCANECLTKEGLSGDDIRYLIPHQANTRIIDSIAKRCQIVDEKVFNVIDRTGNTCAASIGIVLDSLITEKGVSQGDHLLLVAFGGGLTWGSMVLTSKEDMRRG